MEVVEAALARLERTVKAFELDEPPGAVGLTHAEREAVHEVERLEPGAPLLATLSRAQRREAEAAEAWARRHGLRDAATHLPLKGRQNAWVTGAPPISRMWWALLVSVFAFSGVLVPRSEAFLGSALLLAVLAPIGVILAPARRKVLVTPRAVVLDDISIPFADINQLDEQLSVGGRRAVLVTHTQGKRTQRLVLSDELADALKAAYAASRAEQRAADDAAGPPDSAP